MLDNNRGQFTTPASVRLLSGLLIGVAVAGLVLNEVFNAQVAAMRGERITELGGPWMTPAEGVGVLVLGAVVIGSVHLLSWLADRRSANGDRDSANGDRSVLDDDRGQFTTPPAFIVAIFAVVVLVVLVAEFGPGVLALVVLALLVVLFIRISAIIGAASK